MPAVVDLQPAQIMIRQPADRLLQLVERHAIAVATVEMLKRRQIIGGETTYAQARAIAQEGELRTLLIDWRPPSVEEAQTKILYLVQFLARTRTSFNASTMSDLESSIAHLLR